MSYRGRSGGDRRGGGGGGGREDLYRQLIEGNDLVRELDDIEAISQQISQHAEVLYQSWKNNTMQQQPNGSPARGGGGGGARAGSLHHQGHANGGDAVGGARSRERGGGGGLLVESSPSLMHGGGGGGGGGGEKSGVGGVGGGVGVGHHSSTATSASSSSTLHQPTRLHHHHHTLTHSNSSPSGLSSPTSASSSSVYRSATLPSSLSARASATSAGANRAEPLELLASPEINGNLKDLVSRFVTTDRAKQAARQTISDTIASMRRNGAGGGGGGAGGGRSSSPSTVSSAASSTFSSRAVSPLKSLTTPSLMASINSTPPSASSLSPSSSTSSTATSDSSQQQQRTNELSIRFPSNSEIHSRMKPMFGGGNTSDTMIDSSTNNSNHHQPRWGRKQPSLSTVVSKVSSDDGDSIPIPVQHLGRSNSSGGRGGGGGGLQSPKVLQDISTPSFPLVIRQKSPASSPTSNQSPSHNRHSLELDLPLPSLHAANVERMRQRFEEAKQRINLMHARAVETSSGFFTRGNSFEGFGGRGGVGVVGGAGMMLNDEDGGGAFLMEQLRRRTAARRRLLDVPHPELTPQQKQHIQERVHPITTVVASGSGSNTSVAAASSPSPPAAGSGSAATTAFPSTARRFLSGGSVAERVLIFERCPPPVLTAAAANAAAAAAASIAPDHHGPETEVAAPSGLSADKKKDPDVRPVLTWSRPSEADCNRTQPLGGSGVSGGSHGHASAVRARLTSNLGGVAGSPIGGNSTFPALTRDSPSSPPPSSAVVAAGSATPSSPTAISPASSRSSSRSRPPSLVLASSALGGSLSGGLGQPSTGLTLHGLADKAKNLPRFHFPYGNPSLSPYGSLEETLKRFSEEFRKSKKSTVSQEELGQILKSLGYHQTWQGVLFSAAGGEKTGALSLDQLSHFWRRMAGQNHDEASMFVYILTGGSHNYLVPEDFVPLIQDIVDTHPGLGFLKEATEFHSRYVHTVIARIFFSVNRSWSGRISLPELRRSNFLDVLRVLEDEEDINQVTEYFSYEHFYVIYCKFWELDKDHDLFIDREDLSRHNDHAISTRMIDRIFSGAVTRGSAQKEGRMSYTEFVWFLLAEEDKRHPTAVEYWFRCMDLDGDGFLSMYELEYFYEEQLQRMEQLGIETLPFEDCLCQMLDMIMPVERTRIALSDLRHCRMTPIFFDTFFNLEKYLDHEQRDPFASQRELDEDGNEMSDWDRFAAEEYELLVAEEGNTEGMDELCYEDDVDHSAEMHLDKVLEPSEVGGGGGGGGGSGQEAPQGGTFHEPMVTS